MPERYFYLGLVEAKYRIRNDTPVARVHPLYEEDIDDWYRLTSEEIKDIFTNRGRVRWVNPLPEAIEGTVWQFRVEEQRYDEENQEHDAFGIASRVISPTEIIDLRYVGSDEQARKLVSFDGLRLHYIPSHRAYLWVTNEMWIGPVRLRISSEDNNLWILDAKQREQPIPIFSSADDGVVE